MDVTVPNEGPLGFVMRTTFCCLLSVDGREVRRRIRCALDEDALYVFFRLKDHSSNDE